MYRVGDIILIDSYKGQDGVIQSGHPFIVVDDQGGKIAGLDFAVVCNVMSSFVGKPEDYKMKKLSYPENLAFMVRDGNTRDGFIKVDQLYFFDSNVSYSIIGSANEDLMEKLIERIEGLRTQNKLKPNISNIIAE